MLNSGIYKITNTKNGKCYIGQTTNLKTRWQHHRANLRSNKHSNRYLQFAFNKYGEKYFKYEIICRCEESELDNAERYYIKFCNSLVADGGYNIEDGGNKQKHLSEETKAIKSQQLKGKKWTEEHKKSFRKCIPQRVKTFKANYKIENHRNYKRVFSEEECARMRARFGKTGDIEEAVNIYLNEGLSCENAAVKANVGKRRLKLILQQRGLMRPSLTKDREALMVAMAKRKSSKGIPRSPEVREKIRLGRLRFLKTQQNEKSELTDHFNELTKEPTDEDELIEPSFDELLKNGENQQEEQKK